ncbi:grasp-with-spasm system ATP-grasp peptide maturase [Polaribacter sp. IC073]|uniref:grasp-with-spasm system ATP-grasp peptide maturase n=1 Tax=Polaribacter sp. IC073 TaxID=2508540 RepID=UPI0011BDA319|nr:grasp-with-spasm system ATP-grasp peptide maturase [Polaribacter sp. IC073]TXD49763.1 grasp-with-spasm system ATP-grasp peptide maturase [Polaribacter sp. IC073]
MILLISSKYDITTSTVIDWLNKYKVEYKNLNTEEFNSLNSFTLSNSNISVVIDKLDFINVSCVWHRKGRLRHVPNQLNNLGNYSSYLKKEEDALIKSIELYLKDTVEYVGSYLKEIENYKLFNLIKAKEVGLQIPETLITTSKTDLSNFLNKNVSISKDIRYSVEIKTKKESISSCGTFIIKKTDLDLLDDSFAPILVQKQIEKEFEIRVFFFKDKLYSMAIFSQNDEKTKIDFRNYNREKPNRCVPFILPKKIEKKVIAFMSKVNLKTGSIDIIYTTSKEYVFLEVNPMGQLDWVSKNCNYYIEKNIASALIENGIRKN